jgi:hypothetical protein
MGEYRCNAQTKSAAKLREASMHVDYEAQQFNYCVRRLTTEPIREQDLYLFNALLTAYTIYARNLYYFFYDDDPWDDDVVAFEYFDDQQFWRVKRPTASPLLQELGKETNKRSAHITYVRMESDYWWKWVEIHRGLRPTLRFFVAHVPQDRVVPVLIDFEHQWQWADRLPPQP